MSFKIDMLLLCNCVINFNRLTHVFIYTCVFPAEGVPCGAEASVTVRKKKSELHGAQCSAAGAA